MRRCRVRGVLLAIVLAVLPGSAGAQDSGGRETGRDAPPVLFVRSARTAESADIYRAAWKALEPYYGLMSRERLYDFDGEQNRATPFFAERGHAKLVVAFDPQAAQWTPAGVAILRVGHDRDAMIDTRADRVRLARLLRTFRPLASAVAVFGASDELLSGFRMVPCQVATDASGCDVAWITEDAQVDGRQLRAKLDALGIPLVSTSATLPDNLAAVTVRPDARGLGLQLAAQILEYTRSDRAFRKVRIARHRVVVDLDAARAANVRVPLAMLARADVVRRAP